VKWEKGGKWNKIRLPRPRAVERRKGGGTGHYPRGLASVAMTPAYDEGGGRRKIKKVTNDGSS